MFEHLLVLLLHRSVLLNIDLDVLRLDQAQVLLEHQLANLSLFILHINLDQTLNLACLVQRLNLLFNRGVCRHGGHNDFLAFLDCHARCRNLLNHTVYLEDAWDLAIHPEVVQICLKS